MKILEILRFVFYVELFKECKRRTPMKITKKYLEKIIKEELQYLVEIADRGQEQKAAIIAAIEAGLKAAGIQGWGIRVTDVRQYRGSGTGFTVEFDTDIGAIKFNPTPTPTPPKPSQAEIDARDNQYGNPRGGLKLYDD